MPTFEILSTTPTTYQDPVKGVVNGVLVRFRLTNYNEVHDVRVPEMNAATVKREIEKVVKQRDELAALNATTEEA